MKELNKSQKVILDKLLQEMYVLHDLRDAIDLVREKLGKKEDED